MSANSKKNGSNTVDAKLRFCMSEDGMKLGISRYQPPQGQGQPITAEAIHDQLKQAGISLPPIAGAPERVLELLRLGKDYRRVVLVRGIAPREPSDAEIIPEGDIRFPVFPGQIVARKLPPSQGEPGQAIDGRAVSSKSTTTEHKRDLAVQAGENCSYDAAANTFIAQIFGMAVIQEDSVHIVAGLKISENLTTILGLIHYRDHLGQPINALRFKDELERLEVTMPMDDEIISTAVTEAKKERKIQKNVPVVSGREPVNGEDGWLEMLVGNDGDDQADENEIDSKTEPLNIDYRERAALPIAEPDQTIAQLHEPERGVAGIDIYGRPIPAHSGKRLSILPGENVTALKDGFFLARGTGLVVVDRGILMVTQLLVINGDVDIATGNIRADIGSVHVRGMVQSGMTVIAPQHIAVSDTIESAEVNAGGDITVGGGILMDNSGLVTAGGSVTASFANNANVQAGKDVHIKNNATNCHINAGGTVYAIKGKGLIQGGEITSFKGLEVNEIGSDLGVATTVNVVVKREIKRNIIMARRKLKREIKRILSALGNDDPRAILARTSPDKRKAVAGVIKHRLKLEKKLAAVDNYMKNETDQRMQNLAAARIKVWTSIHPGVTIKLGGRVLTVDRRIDRSQIYWSQDERRIIIGRLGRKS